MRPEARTGFTLIELMIVIAIIAIIAAIAIPGMIQSQRTAHERSSSASMKSLTSAEADFKVNDRDGNKINDFWTQDMKGLYTFSSHVAASVGTDTMIKLIEITLAGADTLPTATTATGCVSLTAVTTANAKSGYWFQALDSDLSGLSPEIYRQATNGTDPSGAPVTSAYFNLSKFGFVAYPETPTVGKYAYAVNETNTVYRRPLSISIRASTSVPPGPQSVITAWPTEADFKTYWGKLD